MHTIHKLAVLLLVQVLALLPLQAQVFSGTAIPYNDQELNQSFSDYQIYALDWETIVAAAEEAGAGELSFRLQLANQYDWEITLAQLEQRSEDYTEIAMTDQGPVAIPRRPCITYAGYLQGEGESRFTIAEKLFLGYVETAAATYFLEPLARMTDGAPDNYFIVYNTADVIEDGSLTCGFEEVRDHHRGSGSGSSPGGSPETLTCTEVDFALAADYDMFTKYGSTNAVVDQMLTVTSLMEGLYDDFDFDYIVRTTFVPTTSGSDPFTSSTSANSLLSSFRSWAPTGFGATHDIGQLWTDRNLDGSTIGLAYVGTVCTGSRYNICEDFSSSSNSLRVLSAHECGHNWDATHTDEIMDATLDPTATTWNGLNVFQILTHAATRSCTSDCAATCPSSYNLVDYISSGLWAYEAANTITSTGQISGTADVTYDAGSKITLEEGFSATGLSGGEFNAILDGCSSPLVADDVSRNAAPVIAESQGVQLFPNPASTRTTLAIQLETKSEVELTVFDMTGKLVATPLMLTEFPEGTQLTKTIDLGDFVQGAYLVRITINGQTESKLLNVVH